MTDEYFDLDETSADETAGRSSTADDGSGASQTPDRRALLVSLAEGGGSLAEMAAAALEAHDDRLAAATLAEAQLAEAASVSPRTISQIVDAYNEVKNSEVEEGASLTDEQAAAVQAYDELRAALATETEQTMASELQASLDALRQYHVQSGDPDDVVEAAVARYAEEYGQTLAIEMSNESSLAELNPRWLSYEKEAAQLRREKAVLDQMALDDPGYLDAVVSAAQDELDVIIGSRLGAVVGGNSHESA